MYGSRKQIAAKGVVRDPTREGMPPRDLKVKHVHHYYTVARLTEASQKDLLKAFKDNFQFKGSFASGRAFPSAPNPTLTVDGIGGIGLPLTEEHAGVIIQNAQQAPFGHNQQTVVDTRVRDTFEIDASRVHFRNPAFVNWLKNEALMTVTSQLGTETRDTSIELYKLLLYRPGSHFHKHQDTAKSPGMFATIIVVLPCEYTGGEVVLTHADSSQRFDFSKENLFSTIVMSWYTDVFHEVKPVTSGYRLALAFNLVRSVNSSLELPRLPDMSSAVANVRAILTEWKEKKNQYRGAPNTIAYILSHEYSESDLGHGASGLKGRDAHLVRHVRDVAVELGFVLALANLDLHQSGAADDDGYSYHKRSRYCYYDDDDPSDDGNVGMLEVYESNLEISCLNDLDGVGVEESYEVEIDESALVPENYFEGREPDDKEYEGYMGNGAGQLDQYYHTSAFIIIHEDEPGIAAYKAREAMRDLECSSTSGSSKPTPRDRELVQIVLKGLKHLSSKVDHAYTLLYFASEWKDLTLMADALGYIDLASVRYDSIVEVWEVFGWDVLSFHLDKVISNAFNPSTVQSFLNKLPEFASPEEKPIVQNWLNNIADRYILSLKEPYTTDIPVILTAIRKNGFDWFNEKVFPNFVKENDAQGMGVYMFWREFVKDLLNSDVGTTEEASSSIVRFLEVLAKLWEANRPNSYSYGLALTSQTLSEHADNIVEIVGLTVRAGHPETCGPLFKELLLKKKPVAENFLNFYEKLVPRIAQIKDLDVTKEPFKSFMALMIGMYLQHVVGPKPKGIENIKMRTIGCGCENCKKVNGFLRGSGSTVPTYPGLSMGGDTMSLSINKKPREHLCKQLDGVKDLVSYEVSSYGRPQPIMIKKSATLAAKAQWKTKQERARGFLKNIGSGEVVKNVMGSKFEDMLRALDGSKAQNSTSSGAAGSSSGASLQQQTARTNAKPDIKSGSGATLQTVPKASGSSTQAAATLAGNKRKKPAGGSATGVIDLTMHDECPSLDYAGSVVSSAPSTSVPSTTEAEARLQSLVTLSTASSSSTRKSRRQSLGLFRRRREEVTFSTLFRSHSQRTSATPKPYQSSSSDYACAPTPAEMMATYPALDDDRPTRKSKFENRLYSFLTRSRSRSRSKTSSNDVSSPPSDLDPHSRNSSWSSRKSHRHHDHPMPPSSKPTSILQSRPISSTTTTTNNTITPPTPKASRTVSSPVPNPSTSHHHEDDFHPPSRPSTPKNPSTRRKFFGIPLSSSRKSSISSSRGTSPGGSNKPLPATDVPPLPHHPDLAHDHDPTPKAHQSRSPIPFSRPESPSPLPRSQSDLPSSKLNFKTTKFFSPRHRKSDIPSPIPLPPPTLHDPHPTPSSSSSSNAPSSSNHSHTSPVVSGPTRQASSSRIARRRASTSATTESNASSTSIAHRAQESVEGVDFANHIPRITTTPATPSKPTSTSPRMSHRKNSLDSSVGYRYRPLVMVDEERASQLDPKGKGKDTTAAKSEKSDASSGSRHHWNGRRGPPVASKPVNIRTTKHGSFDFERPGWGTGGVISRSLSANSGSTGHTQCSKSLDSGGSRGVVKVLDKDLLASKKERGTERQKDKASRNTGDTSRKTRPSPIRVDEEEAKPRHRTASVLGLSSSLGRSSGKNVLGSGIARLIGAGHGPFSFEPPVPSPTYSQHSHNSHAETAFSDGEVTATEKTKERRRRADKDRTRPRGRARFEEPLPPSPRYASSSEHRPNGKGRSLDLGLGLAWAPSKVREDALLPAGTFVNGINGRKSLSASSRRGLSRAAAVDVDMNEDRSKVGKEIAEMFKNALDADGFAKFKKYVLQFDAHEIPFDGPTGIVARAERLLDKASNLEADSKQRLVENLVRIILQNA
ncbi:hypothetical protein K435DRAFT_847203 [Dendrothele bispora CBS 962.96]|uniref:Fe2OG dioxygenase domain-containing protein n=1 Tax=Dendrothele bispora (strain CBS 962.96) TaxID=1314807 RepID=A0A4S8MYX3_DENBC|nr:hypothetical protein K435DRAFT_847203 [Dendrothele bispora CBS 962.96]